MLGGQEWDLTFNAFLEGVLFLCPFLEMAPSAPPLVADPVKWVLASPGQCWCSHRPSHQLGTRAGWKPRVSWGMPGNDGVALLEKPLEHELHFLSLGQLGILLYRDFQFSIFEHSRNWWFSKARSLIVFREESREACEYSHVNFSSLTFTCSVLPSHSVWYLIIISIINQK